MKMVIVSRLRFNFVKEKVKSSVSSIAQDNEFPDGQNKEYFIEKNSNEYTFGHTSKPSNVFRELDFKINEKELIEYVKTTLKSEAEKIWDLLLALDNITMRYNVERVFSEEEKKEWGKDV
jgi:hypothetical protein